MSSEDPKIEEKDINQACTQLCDDQDWFIYEGKNKPYKVREATLARFLINGKDAFKAMYEAMIQTKDSSIDILAYDFDPAFCLLGPNTESLGELLSHKGYADNTDIRIIRWRNSQSNFNDETRAIDLDKKYKDIGAIKATGKKTIEVAFGLLSLASYSTYQHLGLSYSSHNQPPKYMMFRYQANIILVDEKTILYDYAKEVSDVKKQIKESISRGASRYHMSELEKNIYDYGYNKPYYYSGEKTVKNNLNSDIYMANIFPYLIGSSLEIGEPNPIWENKKNKISIKQRDIASQFSVFDIEVESGGVASTAYDTWTGVLMKVKTALAVDFVVSNSMHYASITYKSIIDQESLRRYNLSSDRSSNLGSYAPASSQEILLSLTSLDHQSSLLVGYETPHPENTRGFVLGHHFSKHYYDDSNHRMFSNNRWIGFRPVQSVSVQLRGVINTDLNRNFSKMWSDELYDERNPDNNSDYAEEKFLPYIKNGDKRKIVSNQSDEHLSTAQLLRTEPRYNDQSILNCYLKAIKNACQYIYFETSAFQYLPIVEHLKKCNMAREEVGMKPLYVFILTNRPIAGSEYDNTQMTEKLGYGEALPMTEIDLYARIRDYYNNYPSYIDYTNAQKAALESKDKVSEKLFESLKQVGEGILTINPTDENSRLEAELRNAIKQYPAQMTGVSLEKVAKGSLKGESLSSLLKGTAFHRLADFDYQGYYHVKRQYNKVLKDYKEHLINTEGNSSFSKTLKDLKFYDFDVVVSSGQDVPPREFILRASKENQMKLLSDFEMRKAVKNGVTFEEYIKGTFIDPHLNKNQTLLSDFDPISNRIEEEEEEEAIEREDVFKRSMLDGLDVLMGTLITRGEVYDGKYHYYTDIDIQSNVTTIDDVFSIIGSAAISKRGLKGNSELAVGIKNGKESFFTKELRDKLWKNHTGYDYYDSFEKILSVWEGLMDKNWRDVQYQKKLSHHLFHYYNPETRDIHGYRAQE